MVTLRVGLVIAVADGADLLQYYFCAYARLSLQPVTNDTPLELHSAISEL